MRVMTKAERVAGALARQPVDRPPVAFWRHVPDVDHTARGLADAMLAFHRRWDLDLIKVMSSGVYCVEDWGCDVEYAGAVSGAKQCRRHAVQTRADWARIKPLDVGAGALGRELEAVRLTVRGRVDDAPVLHTLFSPLTIARKLAGDRVVADLREAPEAVLPALDAIADTVARYAGASLDAGAEGLFFATQAATRESFSGEEHERFDLPRVARILRGVDGRSRITMLHVHGDAPYLEAFTGVPVHALNWHDRTTPTSLGVAARRFTTALAGGLNQHQTLRKETPAAVATETRDAITQTGGVGLIVTPGCVLPLDVPDASLAAVVATVKAVAR
jgi:uroporphyrinogen decarboxylase